MDTNTELKGRSIRADETTYEKFKAIAQQEFENQGQALAALINLFEIEKGKATIVERKVEIENYQAHINAIGEMFITSLQLNQDAELRIRSEFEALLSSKDKTIVDLQEKMQALTELSKENKVKIDALKDENSKISYEYYDFKNEVGKKEEEYNKAVVDKDKLINALEGKVSESNNSIAALVKEKDVYTEKLNSFENIKSERDDYKTQFEQLSAMVEQLKKSHNEQIEMLNSHSSIEKEKALLEKDKESQQTLAEVREQAYTQLKEYIDKVENLRAVRSELEKKVLEYESKLSDCEKQLESKNSEILNLKAAK